MFQGFLGNESIQAYLEEALKEERLPQTLLFSGMEGIGKGLLARELAKRLLKTEKLDSCPDFHLLSPEGKSGLYSIESIRELIDEDHAAPFEGDHQIFLLEEADRMQPAAANALLKTLEEPSPATTFILLSSAPQEILPTILSRCVQLIFQPVPKELIEKVLREKNLPFHFAKRSHGSIGKALEWAQNPLFEELKRILYSALSASQLEKMKGFSDLEKKIDEIKEEAPLQAQKLIESLFSQILIWARDREALQVGADPFFPDEKISFSQSLPAIEKVLDEARLAHQRNIKLSVCLERMVLL